MFADTGFVVVVTAGTITLTADGKFASAVTTRETVAGNVSVYVDHVSGTWLQGSSGAITLTPSSGPIEPALWSGTKLTVTQSDGVFVYMVPP